VLAPYAEAVINHRVHPSQTVAEVLENFTVVICLCVYFPAVVSDIPRKLFVLTYTKFCTGLAEIFSFFPENCVINDNS